MKRILRVAAAQIPVTADIAGNVARIGAAIRQAVRRKATVVVFPECAITGYPPADGIQVAALDRGRVADALDTVRALARRYRIHVIVGSIRFDGRRAFNTAYAITPAGRVACVYDKVQLVCWKGGDTDHFVAGHRLPVFRVNGTPCAMQICLDARYPESYRYLAGRGARIVFQLFFGSARKCEWKLPVLEGTLRCRAAENGIFMVAANVARRPQMVVSRICDPSGRSLAEAAYGRPQVIVADLDLRRRGDGFRETQRRDLLRVAATRKLKAR